MGNDTVLLPDDGMQLDQQRDAQQNLPKWQGSCKTSSGWHCPAHFLVNISIVIDDNLVEISWCAAGECRVDVAVPVASKETRQISSFSHIVFGSFCQSFADITNI